MGGICKNCGTIAPQHYSGCPKCGNEHFKALERVTNRVSKPEELKEDRKNIHLAVSGDNNFDISGDGQTRSER